jgi:hypothetical protein
VSPGDFIMLTGADCGCLSPAWHRDTQIWEI